MTKMMKVDATRDVFPWVLLWNRCEWAYEDAYKNDELAYLHLYSMLLCAFTLEAFMNYLLSFNFPGDWKKYEGTATPGEKLSKLSELLNFVLDRSKRPFQTFKTIFRFRNDLVHAKPTKIDKTFTFPVDKFLKHEELPPIPKTKWEEKMSSKNAKLFYEDTKEMILILNKMANLGEDPFSQTYSRTRFKGNL